VAVIGTHWLVERIFVGWGEGAGSAQRQIDLLRKYGRGIFARGNDNAIRLSQARMNSNCSHPTSVGRTTAAGERLFGLLAIAFGIAVHPSVDVAVVVG